MKVRLKVNDNVLYANVVGVMCDGECGYWMYRGGGPYCKLTQRKLYRGMRSTDCIKAERAARADSSLTSEAYIALIREENGARSE